MPTASFTEIIHWLAPTNKTAPDTLAAALLLEQRTITVTVDEKNQEVALRWDSEFQVGPNAGKVTIMARIMTAWACGCRSRSIMSPYSRTPPISLTPASNSQNVIAARWTSVSGVMDGHEVLLVLFGRPDNARGDGFFFSMLDPFAYLTATQGLDKQPLEYSAGDKFNLSYLLTVYSENKRPEFIRQRCELWEKERQIERALPRATPRTQHSIHSNTPTLHSAL